MIALMMAACQMRGERALVRASTDGAARRVAPAAPVREAADLARLTGLRVDGYTTEARFRSDAVVELALREQVAADAAPLQLRVTIARCLVCPATADLAAWRQRSDGLRLLLPSGLREAPDTIFELAPAELGRGERATRYVATYQLGFSASGGLQSHALAAYWNDGIIQARVIAQDGAAPAPDRDALARRRGRQALQAAAERALAEVLTMLRTTRAS
jgi:hypothetical protein